MEKSHTHSLLSKVALMIAILGAIASLGFVFYAGHNNKSILLRSLFIGWVLSPFAALLAANISKRWALNTGVVFYWLTIMATIISPVIYSGILSAPGVKLTPYFLFVPLVAWIVIAVFILAASKSRR